MQDRTEDKVRVCRSLASERVATLSEDKVMLGIKAPKNKLMDDK